METTIHTVRVSDGALRRMVRQIDARPVGAYDHHEEAELLAQRLRRIPPANLRRRISLR